MYSSRVEPDKGSKVEVKLLDSSRERRVPATRLSRVFSFGSLGVGLGRRHYQKTSHNYNILSRK